MRSKSVSLVVFCILFFNIGFTFSQTAVVKFEVKIPAEDKSGNSSVFLAGSFNCWNPHDSLYIMKEIGPNLYSLPVPVFAGHKYEYKYTLGSWETVETSSEGEQIKNRTIISQKGQIVKDTVQRWNSPDTSQKIAAGNLNKEQAEMLSNLKEQIGNKLEEKMTKVMDALKKANENMLSEKPDMNLRMQYHNEIIVALDSTLNLATDLMWKVSSMLTPEQKKEILSEMDKNNDPNVLFEWISKAMQSQGK